MPEVTITCGHNLSLGAEEHATDVQQLGRMITTIVAEELTCSDEGGQLDPEMVKVAIRQCGPLDLNVPDLDVKIVANTFLSRKANIHDRQEAIERRIEEALTSLDFHSTTVPVWIHLVDATYGEISLPEAPWPGGR